MQIAIVRRKQAATRLPPFDPQLILEGLPSNVHAQPTQKAVGLSNLLKLSFACPDAIKGKGDSGFEATFAQLVMVGLNHCPESMTRPAAGIRPAGQM